VVVVVVLSGMYKQQGVRLADDLLEEAGGCCTGF
jgi:hypothetical protein